MLGRPCGTGPGYGPGFAKIAKMLAWARGGAGPAPWARRGPRWSRRGCEPGQIEHLPGTGVNHISLYKTNTFRYRAELAKVKNLGWTRAGAGLDLRSWVWGHRAGAAGVLGWGPGLGKCRAGPSEPGLGAPGWGRWGAGLGPRAGQIELLPGYRATFFFYHITGNGINDQT